MRTTLTTTLLAAALLLSGPAHAGWLDEEPVRFTVPPLRVGDKLLFRLLVTGEAAEATASGGGAAATSTRGALDAPVGGSLVLHVEGTGFALDRFGVERPVDVLAAQMQEEGGAGPLVRCHRLSGGREAVRVDPVGEAFDVGGDATVADAFGLAGTQTWSANATTLARYSGACPGVTPLNGRTLREGDRVALDDVLPEEMGISGEGLSLPAVATTVDGRDALRLSFASGPDADARPPAIEAIVVADLPVVRTVIVRGLLGEGSEIRREVAGIDRGEGPALLPDQGARLPAESPRAAFIAPDRLSFDDAPFAFPLPYAEAYRALRDDPRGAFAAWLRDHPGAHLAMAWFQAASAAASPGSSVGPRAGGWWWLSFEDGDAGFSASIELQEGLATPLGPVGAPAKLAVVRQAEPEDVPRASIPPSPRTADARSLTALLASVEVDPRDATSVFYVAGIPGAGGIPEALMVVSTVSYEDGRSEEGRLVLLDPSRDALFAVAQVRLTSAREGGLLAPPSGGSERMEDAGALSGLAILAGPGVGAGLAAGGAAATGLALLLVIVKFLAVPLFTRLRRDRLLDNPVRARLYERVRAEPGIHLAELTDFAAIGNGAARHHLDQLVKHRLLVETRDGGFVRYFAAGEVPPEVARREMALRGDTARRVYDLLAAEPGLSLRQAGVRLGVSAPSVHRHRRRLEKAGLLPAAPAADVRAVEA